MKFWHLALIILVAFIVGEVLMIWYLDRARDKAIEEEKRRRRL